MAFKLDAACDRISNALDQGHNREERPIVDEVPRLRMSQRRGAGKVLEDALPGEPRFPAPPGVDVDYVSPAACAVKVVGVLYDVAVPPHSPLLSIATTVIGADSISQVLS
jgi:hypothetical protein